MKFRFAGKEKLLALGAYPTVSLKDVSDDRAGAQMLNQFIRARDIGNLSLGGNQPQGASGVIDGKVQLGGQSTSRAPKRLWTVFFELRTNAAVRARWSNRSTHA